MWTESETVERVSMRWGGSIEICSQTAETDEIMRQKIGKYKRG